MHIELLFLHIIKILKVGITMKKDMKIEKINSWNLPMAAGLIMGLLLLAFVVTGCDEGVNIVDPVITEPGEPTEPIEPTEPTTNGEVKQPEPTTNGDVKQPEPTEPSESTEPTEPTEPVEPTEPTEPQPTEPEPVEPEPEPTSTVTLPPGYVLPPELIPATPPMLSANEAALVKVDETVKKHRPDVRDATDPTLQTQAGHTADLISLLPHKEREEVYELFVASVNLPSFAKAAERMKEINIMLRILGGEAYRTGDWDPYWDYSEKVSIERGFLGQGNLTLLADIYFEENPQDAQYRDGTGHSSYWIILEYYRLQLENPKLQNLYEKINPVELLRLFRESCKKGYIFGLDNPWN